MNYSLARKCHVESNPVPMKTSRASRLTSCVLGLVLALLLLSDAFGAERLVPAPGQPTQVWSKVDYDPKLTDPFFESNEWSLPWWIIEQPDGTFESTRSGDERPVRRPPRLKHTAKCFSNRLYEHPMDFCEARLLDPNTIELSIEHKGAAFIELMRVRIRNGKFTTEYSMTSSMPMRKGLRCAKKRHELTLDKERYRKGDVIKGKIYYECVWESTDPKHLEEDSGNPPGFKVYGVFKTVVK
jgi:hypothetical protein